MNNPISLVKVCKVCKDLGIKIKSKRGNVDSATMSADRAEDAADKGWRKNAKAWTVTLSRKGTTETLTVPFWQGSAHKKAPTAADVLECLVSDARAGELTFEEFCSEFDYDTDSRKVYATWESCAETAPKLRAFLGDDFDLVANAEH